MRELGAPEHEMALLAEGGFRVLAILHGAIRRGGGGVHAGRHVLSFIGWKGSDLFLEGGGVDLTRFMAIGHRGQVIAGGSMPIARTPAVGDADFACEGGADGTEEEKSGSDALEGVPKKFHLDK